MRMTSTSALMLRWVEHDPLEIWDTVLECISGAVRSAEAAVGPIKVVAVGITNQRETTIVWDRITGGALPSYCPEAVLRLSAVPSQQDTPTRWWALWACRRAAARRDRVDGPQDGGHLRAHDAAAGLQRAPLTAWVVDIPAC